GVLAISGDDLAGKAFTAAAVLMLNAGAGPEPLGVLVERGGAQQRFTSAGVRSCGYPVLLKDQDTADAYADGRRIVVTTGVMRFVRSPAELAMVVGHEIAHNAMGHRESVVLGALLDSMVAAHTGVYTDRYDPAATRAFSRETE